jgi:uncharacterized DUF497 family protein
VTFYFSWDPKKAASNRRKHGISFEEAITVFPDPLARIEWDADHSESEERELILGKSFPDDLSWYLLFREAARFE